ncbi:type II secretion system F family protein [Anaeroselena agilis]|uniref:Type II secretion system F family protein n=1 Tax=Anaeroselena agilis TaxID=3063788 RepID=A0ABU3P3Q4_9FIRM|nr:type II secretion system F family protein [Selenomonadales bacterium 4137-cl]
MPFMIAAVTFLAVLTVLAALIYYLSSSRRELVGRLSRYVELPAAGDVPLKVSLGGAGLSGWRAFVRRMSRHFESPRRSRTVERKLVQAGLPLRAAEFMVICAGAAGLGALLLLTTSGGKLAAAVIGGCGGFIAPHIAVRIKAAKRLRLFNDQLGDALVLTANSLRTGYSFLQALEMVAREMPEPIAGEFARTLKEMALGMTTDQAMNNLARRMDSDDLDLVVTAVLIQRQVGGNLAEVLDNIAGTIRARVKLKGEIRTLTAQGRASGVVLAALPVCVGLAVFVINPGYISLLFTHPIGQAMTGGAIVGQLFGALVIREIINIKL